jgi:hypothetical protein
LYNDLSLRKAAGVETPCTYQSRVIYETLVPSNSGDGLLCHPSSLRSTLILQSGAKPPISRCISLCPSNCLIFCTWKIMQVERSDLSAEHVVLTLRHSKLISHPRLADLPSELDLVVPAHIHAPSANPGVSRGIPSVYECIDISRYIRGRSCAVLVVSAPLWLVGYWQGGCLGREET